MKRLAKVLLAFLLVVVILVILVTCDSGWTGDNDNNQPDWGQPPVLNSIAPTSVLSHTAAFTLTCSGSNFINGATIVFNNKEMATTYFSSQQMTCTINPNDTLLDETSELGLSASTNVKVYIKNPPTHGSLESEKRDFIIKEIPTFTTPQVIDEKLKDSTPGLLVDSNGNIYIVAHAGNEGLVLVRSTDKGSSWSSRKTIDEEEGWCLISAVIDSSDNIYVAITSGGQQWIKFYRSTDNGDSWSDTVKITRSKKPDLWSPYIAAGNPGNLVLAWGKYEGGNLNNIYYRYSTDHGKSWSQPQYIAEANSISFGPDKSGQFNMVMDYQEGVYFSRSTNQGKSWSNPKYITTGGSPGIKIDSSGILNVLFHSDSLKFFRSFDNGVTWSEQYTVYNYWIFCTPSLAVDNLGNLNVVWIGYNEPSPPPNDTYDGIYYSRSVDNGQNWTDNLDLSNGREIFHGASIAIDKEGTIYIIWGVKKIKDGIEYENVFFTRSTD